LFRRRAERDARQQRYKGVIRTENGDKWLANDRNQAVCGCLLPLAIALKI
jgi:hypothetical protein